MVHLKHDAQPVLYVMDTLGLSGRTKGFIDLALHLDPKRYRPVFCSLGSESSALVDRLRERSIEVEFLPETSGVRSVGNLVALVKRHGIRVIHPVNQRPLLQGGLAAAITRIRAVGSLSAFGCQVPDRTYKFLPAELRNRSRRHALRNQIAVGLMRFVVALSEQLCERFCRFTSTALGPGAALGYRALRRRMRSISYGIDPEPYRAITPAEIAALRMQLGAERDTVLVGSIGRLVEQKDYPTQLEAFAIAARVEPRLRMVIAGDGPLRGQIERQAAELGIADRVKLVGYWTRVPALLRALDAFVLASKFEPYGVALLEAMCAGTAIVSTSVNEVPHILDHGVTGLTVPPEDPDRTAEALLRFARDPQLRRDLGSNALDAAGRKHSIHAVANAYQTLYDAAV
jgi:glycosyltransferase involved in cell wall biosynthesis